MTACGGGPQRRRFVRTLGATTLHRRTTKRYQQHWQPKQPKQQRQPLGQNSITLLIIFIMLSASSVMASARSSRLRSFSSLAFLPYRHHHPSASLQRRRWYYPPLRTRPFVSPFGRNPEITAWKHGFSTNQASSSLSLSTTTPALEQQQQQEQDDDKEEAIFQQLKALAAEIRRHDDLYYNTADGNLMISDEEFDALCLREAQLCQDHPDLLQRLEQEEGLGPATTRYGGRVGAIGLEPKGGKTTTKTTTTMIPTTNDRLQRRHGQKCLSLDNVVERAALDAWIERAAKAVLTSNQQQQQDDDHKMTILTEPKLDGLSLSLRYSPSSLANNKNNQRNWSLQWAATRGDGSVGQDVTTVVRNNLDTFGIAEEWKLSSKSHNLLLFPNDSDNDSWSLEIRGEVVFPNSVFDELERQRRQQQEDAEDETATNETDATKATQQYHFSNPRNAASGILLRKQATDDEEVDESTRLLQRHLVFYAYDIVVVSENDTSQNPLPLLGGLEIRQILQEAKFNVPTPFVATTVNLELNPEGDAPTWKESDLANLLEYHKQMGILREKLQQEDGSSDADERPQSSNAKTKDDVTNSDFEWGDYAMDGCVHKIAEASLRTTMGFTSRAPKWAVAHKFPAQQVVTRLLGMEVQVGRTGALTPVAILEPVELGGVLVQRATLHNFDQMRQILLGIDDEDDDMPDEGESNLCVPVGSSVLVRRAGDVIPQVLRRVGIRDESPSLTTASDEDLISLKTPTSCPACGSPLEGTEQGLRCCGPQLECEPRAIGALVHAFSRKALYVKGLSEKRIHQLREEDLLIMPSDLFMNSTTNDKSEEFIEKLVALDGWQTKSATNLVQAAKKVASDGVSFSKFLYSLGIRFLGSETSSLVARAYGSVDDFLDEINNVERLQDPMEESFPTIRDETDETKGIGPSLLESLTTFAQDPSLVEAMRNLRQSIRVLDEEGARRKVDHQAKSDDGLQLPFAGLSIVFTGRIPGMKQSEAQDWAKKMGARSAKGSVTRNTGLFVSGGKKGGEKLEKALTLGVTVMYGDEFVEAVNDFQNDSRYVSLLQATSEEDENGQNKERDDLPFSGISIVFTGTLPGMSRDDVKELGTKMGAKVTNSVTSKTGLVVSGNKAGGAKLDKATKLDIRIMEAQEFLEIAKPFLDE